MDELKNYVQKTAKDKIVLGLFSIVFAVASCVFLLRHSWVLGVIMLLCAVALCVGAVTSSSVDKKFFDAIENSSEKLAIIADFETAQSYCGDGIRMGKRYIFSKKQARLITYEDIKKLQYMEFHDNETSRTEPVIKVTLTNGKCSTLCSLYDGSSQMQAQEIFEVILSKNPDVEIKM